MDHVFPVHLLSAEAVASTGAVTTSSIDTRFLERMESLAFKAASTSGAADVKIEYQTSKDDTRARQRRAT